MSVAQDTGPLVEVHLLELPVDLWARSQEHTDELVREFMLIAEQLRQEGSEAHVPVRLVNLMDQVTATYSAFSSEPEARLFAAAAAGEARLDDLTYHVPAGAADAAQHLGEMMDEADRYCQSGDHLLTLATSPDLVRFRRWYLSEFARQIAGEAPTPWSCYDG